MCQIGKLHMEPDWVVWGSSEEILLGIVEFVGRQVCASTQKIIGSFTHQNMHDVVCLDNMFDLISSIN